MEIPKSSTELIKKGSMNEYQLVSLLSKRTREIMFGAKPLLEHKYSNLIEIAIRELLAGRIKPQL